MGVNAKGRPAVDETLLSSDSLMDGSGVYAGLALGRLIGGCIVLERLGGQVDKGPLYAAYDPRAERKVVVRLIHPEPGAHEDTEQAAARVRAQVERLAALDHPNLVSILDHGTIAGVVYVTTEFIGGLRLRAWLDEGPRSWPERLACVRGLAAGLAAAHRGGLLHGDLRPETVIVDRQGRALLLDLGLAQADRSTHSTAARSVRVRQQPEPDVSAESVSKPLIRGGKRIGTPAYMAPERYAGEDLDALADQFSLCAVAHEVFHGERPFPGRTAVALMRAIEEGEFRPPKRGPGAPPAWATAALSRGLCPDPNARWPDVDALLAALDAGAARPRKLGLGVAFSVACAAACAALLTDPETSPPADLPDLQASASTSSKDPHAPLLNALDLAIAARDDEGSTRAALALAVTLPPGDEQLRWFELAASFARRSESPRVLSPVTLAHADALLALGQRARARALVLLALAHLRERGEPTEALDLWLRDHSDQPEHP